MARARCQRQRVRWARMLIGLAALAVVMPASARASDEVPHEARGHERSGYSLSDYENINLANGNLSFRVPLWTVHTDGGLAFELALRHDSKVWHTHRYCTLVPDGYETCEGAGGAILEAQVAYAAAHLHADRGECRNVGDVRDFVRLYRFTGQGRYLDAALRLATAEVQHVDLRHLVVLARRRESDASGVRTPDRVALGAAA